MSINDFSVGVGNAPSMQAVEERLASLRRTIIADAVYTLKHGEEDEFQVRQLPHLEHVWSFRKGGVLVGFAYSDECQQFSGNLWALAHEAALAATLYCIFEL